MTKSLNFSPKQNLSTRHFFEEGKFIEKLATHRESKALMLVCLFRFHENK